MKNTNDFLAKFAKGVYRRAPKRLKHSIRNAVSTVAAPQNVASKPMKASSKQRPPSQADPRINISADAVGLTYDHENVLPMLAIENNALHEQLRKSRQQLKAANQILTDAQNLAQNRENDIQGVDAAKLAEDYLAHQPDGRVRHLVIANEYPKIGREYGNGFVHQRVKKYLDAGVAVDVVCAGYSVDQDLYEYDGVRILTGKGHEISEVLKRQSYISVSIHFLNRLIWDAIEPFLPDLDVHVFLHGYECSRWIRQLSNYRTGRDLERAIERSINLQEFWHEVLHHPHQPKSYIFVSDWWRQAVYDDMRLTFPASRVHIVHNYINTELFEYIAKSDDQRFNLLWVRSASNRKYANDIAIEVLKLLSRSEYWDRCNVTVIGDGQYFPEFKKQLGKFPNVRIEQGFVSQEEIAALHKTHGIFLVPSRLDSQGVSRDEAMSSGLVPATNLVTAIPEFVDANSGIVADPENATQLAAGIEDLWANADSFQRLSRAAAKRVREQSGRQATTDQEIQILGIEG